MKILRLDQPGGSENFVYADAPRPSAKAGHVLVQVHACSINQVDIKVRQGLPIGPELPSALGCDMAGVVTEVGAGVEHFKVGDEVYGCVAGVKRLGGTMAEYVVADAKLLAHKPANLSMKQAAAVPLVGITAWEGLDRCDLGPQDHILVHGGMGGVGHMVVQLAAQRGATVSTTVRNKRDDAYLKRIGASHIIDTKATSTEDYVQQVTGGQGFDVVFDTVGGATLDDSFQALAVNGRAVAIATRSTHDLSPLHGKGASLDVVFMLIPMLHNKGREAHGDILSQLRQAIEAGHVSPLVDERDFTLEQGGQAQDYLESGEATGKVVVTVTPESGS